MNIPTKHTPTPGPWTWLPDEGCFVVDQNMHIVAEIPCQGGNPNDGPILAEAGTVYHETGLTPRQLAEQRAELLAALRACLPWLEKAHTAIAKATNQ